MHAQHAAGLAGLVAGQGGHRRTIRRGREQLKYPRHRRLCRAGLGEGEEVALAHQRDEVQAEAPRRSSLLLGMTGITPREVNARLDIGETYVFKVAGALRQRFGKVTFAGSVKEAQRSSPPGGAIALLDATGGDTRCAQSPGGDVGLQLDRIDTTVAFLSPALERICETRSSAPWREAEFNGALSIFGTSLERHREYLEWVGDSLGRRLDRCVR